MERLHRAYATAAQITCSISPLSRNDDSEPGVASDRRRMNGQEELTSTKKRVRSRGRKTARERILAARFAAGLAASRAASKRITSARDAAIAPIIAELRSAGATLRAIAAELNQRRIRTALSTGKWSQTQVARVISRHEELKKFRQGRGKGMAWIASKRAAAIAPVIAEIRASGATSLRAIVAELTKRGIPTARGTGSWSASQVARVMSRNEGRKTRRRKSSQRD
jgi:hypothetical protein